ncbi:TPA: hypothetical protein QH337_001073 [Enterobacter ludwigii]|nr:hypothetical protein [Enterobacter ludwigii]
MRKTNDVTLLLISLFANIAISFLLGYKYKTQLISIVSEAIYYQIIIFISLTMPIIIKKTTFAYHKWRFNCNIKSLQKNAHQIDVSKIGEKEKKMLDEITNKDVETEAKIRSIYEEMQRQSD